MRLFLDQGLLQVTTRDIARAVGISQPSLYAHFKNREAIASELSERAFGELGERMTKAASAPGAPAERLWQMGWEYVRFGLEQSAAYRVAFMLEGTRSGAGGVHLPGKRCFRILHDLFIAVRQSDDEVAALQAQSAWASMHGLVALLLVRPDFPWAKRDRLVRHHLDAVCRRAFA